MKKRQLIELIAAHYVTAIGISLALVTQVASLFMDKVSPFEFSITILLSGLAFYILRGGIEIDVVSGLKKRELEKEIGVTDEEKLNKVMESVEQSLHGRSQKSLIEVFVNDRGFFANDLGALNDLEALLKLKKYGTLEDDKVILEATEKVLAHFERTLKFFLCENKIKIDTVVSVN